MNKLYLRDIMELLNNYTRQNKKIGKSLYYYLNSLNECNDNFLANLLLDEEPYNKKEHIGYICYLNHYLKNKNNNKLNYQVFYFLKNKI